MHSTPEVASREDEGEELRGSRRRRVMGLKKEGKEEEGANLVCADMDELAVEAVGGLVRVGSGGHHLHSGLRVTWTRQQTGN